MRSLPLLSVLLVMISLTTEDQLNASTWWQVRDMFHCGGDLRDNIKFDGRKSTIEIPGDNAIRTLSHSVRYADFTRDEFVLEFGDVSPWITWELGVVPHRKNDLWLPLLKGQGGGTHRAPLAGLGLLRWAMADEMLAALSPWLPQFED